MTGRPYMYSVTREPATGCAATRQYFGLCSSVQFHILCPGACPVGSSLHQCVYAVALVAPPSQTTTSKARRCSSQCVACRYP